MSKKITIAQALKLKKKLITQITAAKGRIQQSNRHQAETEPDYKYEEQYAILTKKTTDLVNLKAAIQKANVPILEKIYLLSELKDRAQFLRQIPVGATRERHYAQAGAAPIEWKNQIGRLDLDKLQEQTEGEIERIQEELDKHNHSALVELV